MILQKQSYVSPQFGMPVEVMDDSSKDTQVTGETLQLKVAATNADDVGSAAGTVVYVKTAFSKITDSMGLKIGDDKDSSFAFVTGTILTTQVSFPYAKLEELTGNTRAVKLAAIGDLLANGEYCIDYRSGLIVGKKATTGTSDTANYKYRIGVEGLVGTVTVDSEFPSAVIITDNFANPTTTSVMGMGMVWDGATWDRQLGDSTDGTLMNLGTNNDVVLNEVTTTADAAVTVTKALVMGGYVNDIGTTSVHEGDGVIARFSARGAIMNNLDTLIEGEDQTNHLMQVGGKSATGAALVGNPVVLAGLDGASNVLPLINTTDGVKVNLGTDNDVTVTGTVTANRPTAPSNVNTTAYAASLVVKASAGTCYEVRGHNSGPAQFVQVHDAASLPAEAEVPEDIIYVAAASSFSITYPEGKAFAAGITVCNSSTGPTKTIGGADVWISAEFA